MDLPTFRALRTDAGSDLLAVIAAAGPLTDATALSLGTTLRRSHPPELVAAALTMTRLRQRGRAKFGEAAARMWFTGAGLEQATHPTVATHRARRFDGLTVADLCCGIGSDLAAFGTVGVDADPLTAAVAAANTGLPVQCMDAADWAGSADAVFVDPARRTERGRVFDVGAYRPSWDFVLSVLADGGAAKVAPGIPHEIAPAGVGLEFVSLDGDLKECVLWSSALNDGMRRRATLLPSGSTVASPGAEDDPLPVGEVGRYLHEPDDAVIRSHLIGTVGAPLDARLIDPQIAYLTTDQIVDSPFLRSYEVTDVLPFTEKPLRALLRERGVGTLTIKKRGAAVEPETLRKQLLRGGYGSAETTLVVTKVAGRQTAILVEPVD